MCTTAGRSIRRSGRSLRADGTTSADQGTFELAGTELEAPSPLVTVTSTVSVASGVIIGLARLACSAAADEVETRLTVAFQVLPELQVVTSPCHLLFPELPTTSTASNGVRTR